VLYPRTVCDAARVCLEQAIVARSVLWNHAPTPNTRPWPKYAILHFFIGRFKVALIEVKKQPVKKNLSSNDCLYCGKPLGIRRFTGAKFCSEAHAQADREEMQRLMIARLRDSRAKLRNQLIARDTLSYSAEIRRSLDDRKEMLREVGPDNGVVGGALGLTRLPVYAYLATAGGEGTGS
jgi:hypothetical protein